MKIQNPKSKIQNPKSKCLPLKYGAIAFLTVTLIFTGIPQGLTQTSAPETLAPLISTGQVGDLVYAPIHLDGRELFPVAAQASMTEGFGFNTLSPIEGRVKIIEGTLYNLLKIGFDPKTLKVTLEPSKDGVSVFASDQQKLQPQRLMILSEMDALVCGFSLEESAEHVAHIVHIALLQAWKERQPQFLQRQGMIAAGILLGMILISLILRRFQKRTKLQWNLLQQRKQYNAKASTTASSEALEVSQDSIEPQESEVFREEKMVAMQQQMTLDQQINRLDLKRYSLLLGQVFVWGGGIALILGLFPYTRGLQSFVFNQPVIVAILLGTNLAIKYSSVLIDHLLTKWLERQSFTSEQRSRWTIRICSFEPLLKGGVALLLALMGGLWTLYCLRIPLGPIFGALGIFGFAISFGSQKLIRDLISGTLILMEDQYALGDFVLLNDIFGRVERITIRITSIRNKQGNLITLSNSDIQKVNNLSKDWSRIKLMIYLAYDTDIDHAIATLNQVAAALMADEFWGSQIIEAETRGVEEVDGGGITIGFRIETKPGLYRKVAREFRRRMKLAFDQEGIKFGIPIQPNRLAQSSNL